MSPTIIFLTQVSVFSLVAIFIAMQYVWPRIKNLNVYSALIPLLLVSVFRIVGLGFADPFLTRGAASIATGLGYGDLISAVIALIAVFFLASSKKSFGLSLAWLYAVVGTLDIMYGFYLIVAENLVAHLGTLALIACISLPVVFVTLIVIWIVLVKNPKI